MLFALQMLQILKAAPRPIRLSFRPPADAKQFLFPVEPVSADIAVAAAGVASSSAVANDQVPAENQACLSSPYFDFIFSPSDFS